MDKYYKNNLALWNELTEANKNSKSYDLPGFLEGRCSLKSIEKEEVGDVRGKSLLHLQCHFGMDSISWAKRGAKVTATDFSDKAIKLGEELNRELKTDVKFILCNLYDLKEKLHEKYDIVFTSYGVLPWLHDLKKWAELISYFLKEEGFFYIVEIHPFSNVFENERKTKSLKVAYPYFYSPEPEEYPPEGSYADKEAEVRHSSYEWCHTTGDIINSLISAGLRIEFLHEFPFCVYDKFPFMYKDKDGWWKLKDKENLPLLFSLKAGKV